MGLPFSSSCEHSRQRPAIEPSVKDTPAFTSELIQAADRHQVQKLHVTLGNPNQVLSMLSDLNNMKSLTFERDPPTRNYLNITLFLEKMKNIPNLRTRGFSFEGTEKELNSTPMKSKLESLRLGQCNTDLMPMNAFFRFNHAQFPALREITVQSCQGVTTSISPNKISAIVRQSTPDEIFEVLKEFELARRNEIQ